MCARRSKSLPEGGRLDQENFGSLVMKLTEVVSWATNAGALGRDDEARALWRDAYPKLSDGKAGLVEAMISRTEAHVMHLDCIYAVLE